MCNCAEKLGSSNEILVITLQDTRTTHAQVFLLAILSIRKQSTHEEFN